MSKGTILIVGSNADQLELKGGQVASIGTYLNELVVPSMALVADGYDIVLATPAGGKPVLDEVSRNASHFNNDSKAFEAALDFFNTYPAMTKPRTLRSVIDNGLDEYAGMFVPGGHAPIIDISRNPEVAEILRHFHEKAKPTALLCHGPITLISAVPKMEEFRAALERNDMAAAKEVGGGWQYAGYKMTIFSNDEEKIAEDQLLKGKMTFYVGDALQAAGGIVTSNTQVFEPHVTRDRELITGQNPRSDHGIAAELIKALNG